jgi:hypothetical protein
MRNAYKVVIRNPEGKENFVDVDVEGKIILRWV